MSGWMEWIKIVLMILSSHMRQCKQKDGERQSSIRVYLVTSSNNETHTPYFSEGISRYLLDGVSLCVKKKTAFFNGLNV